MLHVFYESPLKKINMHITEDYTNIIPFVIIFKKF